MKEVLVEGSSRRGRPLGRWKDRVKEDMCERGAVWATEFLPLLILVHGGCMHSDRPTRPFTRCL